MLKLKVKDRSLSLLQVYAPNPVSKYQAYVNDVNNAFQRIGSIESPMLLRNFNELVGTARIHGKACLVSMEAPRLSRTAGIYCSFVVATGSAI